MNMDIIEKSWKMQRKIENWYRSFGRGKYTRIIKMARKPKTDEYIKILEISGAGLLLIGFLGFTIYLLWKYIPTLL